MMQIRLIIAAVLLVLGGFLAWWVPSHYREQGKQEVIHKYEEASRIALQERKAEIERLKVQHETTNKIVIADYEARLSVLNERYRSAKLSGLSYKPNSPIVAREAETASTERNNEAESVRLPSRIENGLFDLARKADEVNAQLSACQAWIKSNGFYQ